MNTTLVAEAKTASVKPCVRILHLEDNPDDTELVREKLTEEGIAYTLERVANLTDFVLAQESRQFDLVLSDFVLPEFDGLSALKIVRERSPDLPFIIVSGTMGEEAVIEALKSGATDYVLKDRLSRLGPTVRRAIQDAAKDDERRRLEEQFIEAQKMEVIGHLAGGVAHDFNNIIGVIMGYSDLISQTLQPGDNNREHVETIRHAAERAGGLTRQLLVFSRRQAVQPTVLDLNQVLGDLDKMLHRLIDEKIAMTMALEKEIWHVKADSGYVGQVLMNLVVNARDAMPDGGELRIETRNATLEGRNGCVHADVPAGEYVALSVTDTGTGMTDEVKARLFEAFFTTKPKGKGTGLGLATCQTIVKQCNGFIGLQSEVGKGTTFNVLFPRVDLPLETVTRPAPNEPLPRGTETLLLVEDEPAVRHLACTVLEAQGYHVLRASNGKEGIRVARELKGQAIALVITDVVMPQMSGKVMVEWLKSSYAHLKVLFTSGYTEEAILADSVTKPGIAFLPKPYSPSVLLRHVRDLLDGREPKTRPG
ncbi:MAG TPA: response regulator [Verrucomicrobiae bacterium]|jgi:signal transduction histidine kinase